jgi:hypothetical protein
VYNSLHHDPLDLSPIPAINHRAHRQRIRLHRIILSRHRTFSKALLWTPTRGLADRDAAENSRVYSPKGFGKFGRLWVRSQAYRSRYRTPTCRQNRASPTIDAFPTEISSHGASTMNERELLRNEGPLE